GRTAVYGLEQAHSPADAGGWKQSERARKRRRQIRQDVTEEIPRDDDIEIGGPADDLHRRVVHVEMLELQVGEFVLMDACDDLAPEPRDIQHVGLVHGSDTTPPPTGRL